MARRHIRTVTAAAVAGTLVLTACSSEPTLDDLIGPDEETVDETPEEEEVAPEPEPDPVEEAAADVLTAYRRFLAASMAAQNGDDEPVRAVASPHLADALVEFPPVDDDDNLLVVMGERTVSDDVEVTVADDLRSATVVDCQHDLRAFVPVDRAENVSGGHRVGHWVSVVADMVYDDGWKVDRYAEHGPCLPADVAAQVEATAHGYMRAYVDNRALDNPGVPVEGHIHPDLNIVMAGNQDGLGWFYTNDERVLLDLEYDFVVTFATPQAVDVEFCVFINRSHVVDLGGNVLEEQDSGMLAVLLELGAHDDAADGWYVDRYRHSISDGVDACDGVELPYRAVNH